MIAPFYIFFMLALGLATVWSDMERFPSPKRQRVTDLLGAVWLFLLVLGSLMLITE